ncbi:hypothetical protein Vadar_004592 [Vaccinium darrowii]|uniref:Uncharacterized protein n=1 Tax=Vaccinium darrowii TaxID=229202 RepID=A0ACB7Y4W2_9ERIC|nr:hypothetical protein Vadar_004592 [Vaccinium darrowii]
MDRDWTKEQKNCNTLETWLLVVQSGTPSRAPTDSRPRRRHCTTDNHVLLLLLFMVFAFALQQLNGRNAQRAAYCGKPWSFIGSAGLVAVGDSGSCFQANDKGFKFKGAAGDHPTSGPKVIKLSQLHCERGGICALIPGKFLVTLKKSLPTLSSISNDHSKFLKFSITLVLAMAYALPHLLMLLLSLLPFSIVAQSRGVVSRGSSLTADEGSSPWISPSGDFAFGFHKIEKNLFLLSIWYDKIPEKTIIWYANKGNPVPGGSKLELTDRGLQLDSPQEVQLWISASLSGGVASGYMSDTGNFVIRDEKSQELWGSFSYPTDTLLPTQVMKKRGSLISQKTETNFSSGRFSLALLDDGNLVLSTISIPTTHLNEPYYYETGPNDAVNSSNSGSQLVFNVSGYMYVLRENGTKFMVSQGNSESNAVSVFYHRVTLSFDGVLRQYYHPRSTTTGNENCLCRLDAERPKCECPIGYTLLDPNDRYGSCKPNFTLGCEDGVTYDITESPNTDWPLNDYDLLRPYREEECRNSCLHDCMCAVAIFRGDSCWKKRLPLSNGRVDNGEASKAFIKVGKIQFPILQPKKKNADTLVIAGSVLLGSSVLVTALCLAFMFIYNKKQARFPPTEVIVDTNLRCFRYKELVEATKIICCRKSVDSELSGKDAILTDWAYDCYVEGTFLSLVGDDMEALNDRKKLDRFVMVAIWCIQEDPSLRPTMRKAIQMLEEVTEVTVPPCPSSFTRSG